MRLRLLPIAALLTLPLAAQDDSAARWRIALGLGAGTLDYKDGGQPDTYSEDGGAFRLGFEGTSRRGFGGGVRFERFAATGYDVPAFGTTFDLSIGSLFGHFTYRVEQQRFAMPIRVGFLANSASLESTNELTAATAGVMVEIAPEVTLVTAQSASWTLYGEFNLGTGVTVVELDANDEQWDSTTNFTGAEIGTRVYIGPCELSLAYVGRWQSMDQTDPGDLSGTVLTGYDADFNGVMFGFAVVF